MKLQLQKKIPKIKEKVYTLYDVLKEDEGRFKNPDVPDIVKYLRKYSR